MNKKNIKIAVVGGGIVGRVLSVLLSSAGYSVEMVCRDNHRAIKIDDSYAFEVCGDFGRKSYLVPFVTDLSLLKEKKDIIIFLHQILQKLQKFQQVLFINIYYTWPGYINNSPSCLSGKFPDYFPK